MVVIDVTFLSSVWVIAIFSGKIIVYSTSFVSMLSGLYGPNNCCNISN